MQTLLHFGMIAGLAAGHHVSAYVSALVVYAVDAVIDERRTRKRRTFVAVNVGLRRLRPTNVAGPLRQLVELNLRKLKKHALLLGTLHILDVQMDAVGREERISSRLRFACHWLKVPGR